MTFLAQKSFLPVEVVTNLLNMMLPLSLSLTVTHLLVFFCMLSTSKLPFRGLNTFYQLNLQTAMTHVKNALAILIGLLEPVRPVDLFGFNMSEVVNRSQQIMIASLKKILSSRVGKHGNVLP